MPNRISLISAWLLIALTVVFVSCEKIIEENIEDDNMLVLAPADSLSTVSNSITFWWELLDGADGYRLQIVKPSFGNVAELLLDSLVEGDKLVWSLGAGTYQWRVRGENSGYYTDYAVRTLTVDTTSDLSQLTLFVNNPPENYETNNSTITFNWQGLDAVDDYRFEIGDVGFTTSYVDVNINDTAITYVLEHGFYEWRVRGQNSSSNTPYVTRFLTIDTIVPVAPSLVSPMDASVFQSDTVILNWTRDQGASYDSVFIYNDSTFALPIQIFQSTVDSFQYINTTDATYYWRVRSYDGAGNRSQFSLGRKFSLQ